MELRNLFFDLNAMENEDGELELPPGDVSASAPPAAAMDWGFPEEEGDVDFGMADGGAHVRRGARAARQARSVRRPRSARRPRASWRLARGTVGSRGRDGRWVLTTRMEGAGRGQCCRMGVEENAGNVPSESTDGGEAVDEEAAAEGVDAAASFPSYSTQAGEKYSEWKKLKNDPPSV